MKKNKLENWIAIRKVNEVKIMNLLQNYGIVSDNCVWAKDCGNDLKAMRWLAVNPKML
jgi:cell division FtsZ-interacting protein ZapD